jgi:anti-sigma B factor antagonist
MVIASRTPEGEPGRCPICGAASRIEPTDPPGDAPCPSCGCLAWFSGEGKDEVVVRLGGKFVGAEEIRPIAASIVIDSPRRIVFDLDRVEWISSEALGALIDLKKRLRGYRGTVALRHLRPDLREVFRITRLDLVFSIEAP